MTQQQGSQRIEFDSKNNNNINNFYIEDKIQPHQISTYTPQFKTFNSIRLIFDSDPYVIAANGNNEDGSPQILDENNHNNSNLILGYLITLNDKLSTTTSDKRIIIKASSANTLEDNIEHPYMGYYELNMDDINGINDSISSIRVWGDNVSLTIDYDVNIEQKEIVALIPKSEKITYNPGQLYKTMQPNESVINILQQRYNYEVKTNDVISQEKIFTGISR